MTRKIKPTPPPYKIARWENPGKVDGFSTVITDSRGHGIVEFLTYGESQKVKDTVQFIVGACNSHKVLVEELKAVCRTLVAWRITPASDIAMRSMQEELRRLLVRVESASVDRGEK